MMERTERDLLNEVLGKLSDINIYKVLVYARTLYKLSEEKQ